MGIPESSRQNKNKPFFCSKTKFEPLQATRGPSKCRPSHRDQKVPQDQGLAQVPVLVQAQVLVLQVPVRLEVTIVPVIPILPIPKIRPNLRKVIRKVQPLPIAVLMNKKLQKTRIKRKKFLQGGQAQMPCQRPGRLEVLLLQPPSLKVQKEQKIGQK